MLPVAKGLLRAITPELLPSHQVDGQGAQMAPEAQQALDAVARMLDNRAAVAPRDVEAAGDVAAIEAAA